MVEIGEPQRGDVVVFRYPEDPTIDYIKRVVGLPGDRISYRGKVLTIVGAGTTIMSVIPCDHVPAMPSAEKPRTHTR